VAAYGVQIFGADQTMQGLRPISCDRPRILPRPGAYLNEDVVQQEHDSREVPRNFGIPEEILANVAHITNFRMTQAELPDCR
jgi:hypothetical protein